MLVFMPRGRLHYHTTVLYPTVDPILIHPHLTGTADGTLQAGEAVSRGVA